MSKKIKIQINNTVYDIENEYLTGKEILNLAGYSKPDDADLISITKGNNQELIKPDQKVCLSNPGIERFRIRPKKVKDGLIGGESPLPFEDLNFLNNTYTDKWTIFEENRLKLLKIVDFEIPDGYKHKKVDLIIIIPPMYNSVQLDMAYFFPQLKRNDNKVIDRATDRNMEGKLYQQWSRHRTSDSEWIVGEDNIETHIDLIKFFLREELNR